MTNTLSQKNLNKRIQDGNTILALLAVFSTHAFLRRQAGPAILASVVLEIVLVVGYAGFLL